MRSFYCRILYGVIILATLLPPQEGKAGEKPGYSSTLMGPVGLNLIPNARMDKAGTVRLGAGTLDPYLFSFAGFQLTDWFHVNMRQSAEKSSLLKRSDAYYPAVDFKIRLKREGRYDPAIALGLMSGFGHKRTASEYIALSKRYNDFDFTAGIGWGRLAGDGHIRNPLRRISSHFERRRDYNAQTANSAHDWFTGEDIGFFAGLEYRIPDTSFSLKADWGANPYSAEAKTIAEYDVPASWSAGLNYRPLPWMDAMIGLAGPDKLMARLSLSTNVGTWDVAAFSHTQAAPLLPARPEGHEADDMVSTASARSIRLANVRLHDDMVSADLLLDPHRPLAYQLGRAARHMANHAGPQAQTIAITPLRGKIRGRTVTLLRRDLEQALRHHQGSPEEIWNNTRFIERDNDPEDESASHGIFAPWSFNLALIGDIGLSDNHEDYLYRASALVRVRHQGASGFFNGADLRLNLSDNLDKLALPATVRGDPIRGDIDLYTKRRGALDRLYSGWRGSVADDVFVSLAAGALEEMYMGGGGEILYRPFGKTWAIGAEAWEVTKRDPGAVIGKSGAGEPRFTGHVNFWYEVPESDITFSLKGGQYLGEDLGGTVGIDHRFRNGMTIGGFITVSRDSDRTNLGDTTHVFSGMQLTIPLGSLPFLPDGSEVITRFHPQGRSVGQLLDHPEPLYGVTEPVSYRGTSRSWHRLLD